MQTLMQILRAVAAAVLLAAVACATVDTEVDWDPNASFAGLKSYRWVQRGGEAPDATDDPFLDQRVRTAVDEQLAARGYVLASEGEADFLVAWHGAQRREIRVERIHRHYGYYPWPHSRWWRPHAGVYDETSRYVYDIGTLILDVIDPKTKRLIWRGTASALVGDDRTPKEREARVNEMVAALLARFPPE